MDDFTKRAGLSLVILMSFGCQATLTATLPTDTDAVDDMADTGQDSDADTDTNADTGEAGDNRDVDPRSLVPVLLSLHMEAKTARHCTDGVLPEVCTTDEDWVQHMANLDGMVDALDNVGLKGTFQHQIQWLQRLEESETGRAITQKMIDNGHEIGLHHHGWGHADPDGYSNNPDAEGDLFLGSMDDYLAILHAWEERWNYELVTIEGTELNFWDNQLEWLFRTSDDQSNPDLVPLNDPGNACGMADGSGKPAWQVVALPSRPFWAPDYNMVGHTYFGRAGAAGVECQRVYSAHILARTMEIISAGPKSDDAINMVLHPQLDYASPDLSEVYNQLFADVVATGGVVGMTVRDYFCDRVGICE